MAPEEHFLHRRVAEELKPHPPFSELEGEQLLILAENVEVRYMRTNTWLFENNAPLQPYIYFVAKGTVELWRDKDLIDHVEPGELMGLRSLFQEGTYKAGARPMDGKDALVYALPLELARKHLVENNATDHFFHLDWKGNRDDFVPSGTSLRRLMKKRESNIHLPLGEDSLQLQFSEALCVAPETPVFEVAQRMNEWKTDAAIVVDERQRPVGILTDSDFRRHNANPQFQLGSEVHEMMTHPVSCFDANIRYADALVAMVEKRIHHLIITESGTADGAVLGIISDHEVLLEQALNPTIIIKRMERAKTYSRLKHTAEKVELLRQNYINANVSTSYLLKMMTQFYAGLYSNAIRLAEKQLGPAPCDFAWIALGSLGRGEQLIVTDQDHALVYADASAGAYFKTLAHTVSSTMQELGFEEDHFGVSATADLWRGTPAEWIKRLDSWMAEGEGDALLRLSIVQDARAIAGDLNLALPAFNHLYRGLHDDQGLLQTMAKDALRNPSPLGIFKRFKLEKSGQFDLKLRAILPFIDASKVLAALAGKSHINSTIARLEAIKDTGNEELMTSAVHSYEILLDLRVKFALANGDSGRYINPDSLDALDKQLLRNVLKTVEALQDHLKLKFKL